MLISLLILEWVSEQVSKFNGLSRTVGIKVHVINIGRVIITYDME